MPARITFKFNSRSRINQKRWRQLIKSILSDFGLNNYQVAVILVNDAQMAELNSRFRGYSGTTDVLSFVLEENPLEGEIYINPGQAHQIALTSGSTFEYEISRLLIHGLLHLLNLHHNTEAELSAHQRLTQSYLDKVNIC